MYALIRKYIRELQVEIKVFDEIYIGKKKPSPHPYK